MTVEAITTLTLIINTATVCLRGFAAAAFAVVLLAIGPLAVPAVRCAPRWIRDAVQARCCVHQPSSAAYSSPR
ncbi:hypothetical protein [Streptomyces chartreusis]|uniref:hypothetical protein n=1 Tax=Streptomyces chartreusis TaxID=1969 RepID=UPI00382C998B